MEEAIIRTELPQCSGFEQQFKDGTITQYIDSLREHHIRSHTREKPDRACNANVMRSVDFKIFRNCLTMYLLEMKSFIKYRQPDHQLAWLMPYVFDGKYEEKFLCYLKEKFSQFELSEKAEKIASVLNGLDKNDVLAYFHDVLPKQQEKILSSENVRKQTCVPISKERHDAVLEKFECVQGVVVDNIDTTKVTTEILTKVTAEVIKCDKSKILDECWPLFDSTKVTDECIQRNDVYSASNVALTSRCKIDDKTIPILVYAPPGSGKTTFNKEARIFLDTDCIMVWPYMDRSKFVITNMSHLVDISYYSIAVIPSRKKFRERCKDVPGYLDSWYDDIVSTSGRFSLVIHSDRYLGEIALIRSLLHSHFNSE